MEHSDRGWHSHVNNYCERADASFWAEPVNAFSNGAFLIAALAAFLIWRRAGRDDVPALLLIGVIAVIGVGSFLFHTFANRWSLLADVLPITVFIYGYFFLAMRRFAGLGIVAASLATLAFLGFNAGFVSAWTGLFGTGPIATANGSIGYFPAALAIIGVGALLKAQAGRALVGAVEAPARAGSELFTAAGVFALSLFFRAIDEAVCDAFPLGTHFMWHVLNAVVLFLLVRAAIRYRAALSGAAAR
ncbi:MAG: hypothetical protein EA385_15520 [Salinarimonadaceae bacterium]|nr:MAG: hypothetical protein EA385_15520 [Salinarimonadaceae bacterium]